MKYVPAANMWCVTEKSVDPKTKHTKQTIHWFSTEQDARLYDQSLSEKKEEKAS